MTENKGKVVSVNGNLVSVRFEGNVSMNEICYVNVDNTKLKSEVIRIRGDIAQIQVYEMTGGIKCGDDVEFTGEMLSAQLGPGLLGQVYDGLQNPLPVLAEQAGWFLERGIYADGLNADAIEEMKARGWTVDGPVPPDSLFSRARSGQFDGCVAMYHDQGHIAFKVGGFEWDRETQRMVAVKGVNITLGLPIIRVSVDHGTAFDVAGKGIANPDAMLMSIEYAALMAKNQKK